jgi:hypothetical protein
MKHDYALRLKEIYSIVNKMVFSKENLLEIVLLFKETIKIQKKINKHRRKNHCLNYLLNTYEKEYQEMISKNTKTEDEIKDDFETIQTNFLTDLSMYCIDSN